MPLSLEAEPKTVEELLRFSVRFCLEKFHQKHNRNLEVDEGKTILTAMQAFEDGIIAVFVDGAK